MDGELVRLRVNLWDLAREDFEFSQSLWNLCPVPSPPGVHYWLEGTLMRLL